MVVIVRPETRCIYLETARGPAHFREPVRSARLSITSATNDVVTSYRSTRISRSMSTIIESLSTSSRLSIRHRYRPVRGIDPQCLRSSPSPLTPSSTRTLLSDGWSGTCDLATMLHGLEPLLPDLPPFGPSVSGQRGCYIDRGRASMIPISRMVDAQVGPRGQTAQNSGHIVATPRTLEFHHHRCLACSSSSDGSVIVSNETIADMPCSHSIRPPIHAPQNEPTLPVHPPDRP